MIQYLTRNQLDEEKYDHCISNAVNTRIYAQRWYLDRACDDWDVLVKDDYQCVMPLPKRKKYGIHYIYQAPWVQQLGVFSIEVIDESIIHQFIKSIPRKFKLIDILLNSNNTFSSKHSSIRDNYLLLLKEPYDSIRKQFSKGRKSCVRQAQTFNLAIIDNYSYIEIIELFKQNKGKELDKKKLDYNTLSELIKYGLPLGFVKSYGVVNSKNELVGGAIFLIDSGRITYLFSAINNEGREKHAMSFLIDFIIKANASSNFILDFEGSMIKGLASFFKSFGSTKETYIHLKKYQI